MPAIHAAVRQTDGPRFPCFVVRKEQRMRDRNFSICHSIAAPNRRRVLLSLQQSSGDISAFQGDKRMMLITKLFLFSLIQFLLPKSPSPPLRVPLGFPLSQRSRSHYLCFQKSFDFFQSLSSLCRRRRRLSFVTFPRRSFHGFCLSLEIKAERERNEGSLDGFLIFARMRVRQSTVLFLITSS